MPSHSTYRTIREGIRPSQQGFVKDRSYLTNLIFVYDSGTDLVEEGKAVDVSAWTPVKPLTPFPKASSGETSAHGLDGCAL